MKKRDKAGRISWEGACCLKREESGGGVRTPAGKEEGQVRRGGKGLDGAGVRETLWSEHNWPRLVLSVLWSCV